MKESGLLTINEAYLEKAKPHKYIKREGTKGKYIYFYPEEKEKIKSGPPSKEAEDFFNTIENTEQLFNFLRREINIKAPEAKKYSELMWHDLPEDVRQRISDWYIKREEKEMKKAEMLVIFEKARKPGAKDIKPRKKRYGWSPEEFGWPVDVATARKIEIAKKTLKMPQTMAGVMGSPSKEEAKKILEEYKKSLEKARTPGAKDIKKRKKRILGLKTPEAPVLHEKYKVGTPEWKEYKKKIVELAPPGSPVGQKAEFDLWRHDKKSFKKAKLLTIDEALEKARKPGAKDIKPRKKRGMGLERFIDIATQKKREEEPLHPIHRKRILATYGQEGLDYYDRLVKKQGLSHNEALGSVEEAHQRHGRYTKGFDYGLSGVKKAELLTIDEVYLEKSDKEKAKPMESLKKSEVSNETKIQT